MVKYKFRNVNFLFTVKIFHFHLFWYKLFCFISDITCERPNLKTTGALQLSTNTLQQIFFYNESIKFTCTLGYILQGPTIKYCRHNGDFEHNLPTCTGLTIILISFFLNLYFIFLVVFYNFLLNMITYFENIYTLAHAVNYYQLFWLSVKQSRIFYYLIFLRLPYFDYVKHYRVFVRCVTISFRKK